MSVEEKIALLHFIAIRVAVKVSLTVENGRDKVTASRDSVFSPSSTFSFLRLSLLPPVDSLIALLQPTFCIDNLVPKGIVQTNEIDFMRLGSPN